MLAFILISIKNGSKMNDYVNFLQDVERTYVLNVLNKRMLVIISLVLTKIVFNDS